MFIGRELELQELERRYESSGFQLFVLYGRRRVGKTRLIQEFCKNKAALFHVGIQQEANGALRAFSRDVLTALPSEVSAYIDHFNSWEEAFHYAAAQANGKRLVLVIDEYPYLAQSDPSISSVLQKVIDHVWKDTDLFVILCGSSMSFMENQVLGYQSPLYGRRTAQMKILPLQYRESFEFFKGWSWEDRYYGYGVCGGIPQYLEYFSAYEDFPSAVKGELLSLSGHLLEEPMNLMKQEMREPALYNSIIEAVANGASRQNEIATATKKDARDITAYLKALIDLGVLEKQQPIEEKNQKKTIYRLADQLYRFWYRFMPSCLSLISLGMSDNAWKDVIQPGLDAHMGVTYENICLQYIQREVREGHIKPTYLTYGRWWGNNPDRKREEEVDVVAVTSSHILVGECKWRNESMGTETLEVLKARGELIRKGREIQYVLFSKYVFSDALIKQAKKDHVLLLRAEELV